MKKVFFLCCIVCLSACKKVPTNYTLLYNNAKTDIHLQDFVLIEDARQDGLVGIGIQFLLDIPSDYKWEGHFQDYEMYYQLKENHLPIKKFRKPLSSDTILASDDAQITFFIPYSDLQLSKGKHSVNLEIEGNLHRAKDSLHAALSVPNTHAELVFRVDMPDVNKLELVMNHLALDTLKFKASDSDFRLWGSGFPDLMWKMWKGNELIFKSEACGNALVYCRKDSVPTVYVCDKDSLTIEVLDRDIVSDDDLLSAKTVSALAFKSQQKQAFLFGKVKYMTFVTREEKKIPLKKGKSKE